MTWFTWVDKFSNLRLDVVGIVAVLGEGCTSRTIEASSLAWHHVLPRLMPAPQALLRHQQTTRLGTEEGIVIGVYSGNHSPRLNHFCRLLHNEHLDRNVVELVEVSRPVQPRPFGVHNFGYLACLSIIGTILAAGILTVSIIRKDGFAFAATILLALTSTIVGFASKWSLELQITKAQHDRKRDIPSSDVVISYPSGAFRVVRCSEEISRLYFAPEICIPYVSDNMYRFLALLASVFLMVGLLCMGNCSTELQLAFAASYIFLNMCYWAVSAVNPMKYQWSHDYKIDLIAYQEPEKKAPEPVIIPSMKSGGESVPRVVTHESQRVDSRVIRQHTSPELGNKSTFDSICTSTSFSPVEKSPLTPATPASPNFDFIRRRQGTDLEGFKQRIQPAQRSLTAPIQRTFTGFFTPKAQIREDKEQRRFTQALWITIALTGSGRWLKNRSIAPDTDVWLKWIDLAEKRIRSKRNKHGDLVSALTSINGVLVIPPWNYDGTLRALMRRENESIKKRPPPPPILSEIMWRSDTIRDGVYLSDSMKKKLKGWAEDARQRISTDNSLPVRGLGIYPAAILSQ